MSCYWSIHCSCGEKVPYDGVNHGDEKLLLAVRHREALLALAVAGVEFIVLPNYGREFDSDWVCAHAAHEWRVVDEYGRETPPPLVESP